MKKSTMVCAIMSVALISSSPVLAEIRYTVIHLGALGNGYNYAFATSINNSGQVIGSANANYSDNWRGVLFDSTGQGNNIDLGTLGGNRTEAKSIKSNGQIVGYSTDASGNSHAVLFDSTGNGNNVDLGRGGAIGISDRGEIVGSAGGATLFDASGQGNNTRIGISQGFAINNKGQVVGTGGPDGTWPILFDRTNGTRTVNLGALPGAIANVPLSVNDNSQVVGFSVSSEWARAALFDSTGNGNSIDLGTLGGTSSYAFAVNNAGQVVGTADDAYGNTRATVFDPTGQGNNIDLNTLIDPGSGWHLLKALDINDNGWIVGDGWRTGDPGHSGFILVPVSTPEPATMVLLGLGGIVVRRVRKVRRVGRV
jgi:probable HAF family extracellular repeat protein